MAGESLSQRNLKPGLAASERVASRMLPAASRRSVAGRNSCARQASFLKFILSLARVEVGCSLEECSIRAHVAKEDLGHNSNETMESKPKTQRQPCERVRASKDSAS